MANEALLLIADAESIVENEAQDCLRVLGNEDRSALARLGSTEDYRNQLVGRAMLRLAISEITGRSTETIVFDRTPLGKPFLRRRPGDADIRFNLSRSGERVVLGLVEGFDVGVDIEAVSRLAPGDAIMLADDYFSNSEADLVRSEADLDQRRRLFLTLWVAKEAALKATGEGLGGLSAARVDFAARTVRIDRTPPSNMHLHEESLDDSLVAAACEQPLKWKRRTLSSLFSGGLIKTGA